MDKFHLIRSMVENVKSTITEMINGILIDAVQSQIQQMVDSVGPGSDIWYGPGADSFINDCAGFHIPETEGIQDSSNTIIERTTNAVDLMDSADAQCRTLVDNLDGQFAGIVGNLV